MGFEIVSRYLGEVVVIRPEVHEDTRGYLYESFRADEFERLGLPVEFVQDNHTRSRKGATQGQAYYVAVDIRKGSPTLGQWVGLEISAENKLQI